MSHQKNGYVLFKMVFAGGDFIELRADCDREGNTWFEVVQE